MSKQPLVSIIIPCYNMENYLENCFKSLNSQTYKNFEAIFINDGSKDKTEEMLANESKKHENFVVLNKQNEGVSSARNDGLKLAKGKYVCFLDSDDMYFPHFIERMVDLIESNDAQMAICNFKRINDGYDFDKLKKTNKQKKVATFTQEVAMQELFAQKKFDWNIWTKIYVNEIFKKNNIHFHKNIKYGEDELFNYEYLKYAKKVVFADEKLYFYVQRKNSAVHSAFKEVRLSSYYGLNYIVKDVEKNYPSVLPYAHAIRAFVACEMLYFMHKGKYENGKVYSKIIELLSEDAKYLKKCKLVAGYRRRLIPLVPGVAKMILKKQLKRDNSKFQMSPYLIEELKEE